MPELKGLATGIGSLPYKDADSALDLIFKYTPHIPFWPQLPKRDIKEGMVAQFSENLPGLKADETGLRLVRSEAADDRLEMFYEKIINNDADYFKISPDFALGLHKFYQRLEKTSLKDIKFIKCQITGPFTFSSSLKDDKGNALLYDSVLLQAMIRGLMMKAQWQINLFRKFGKKIILFVDEPYLGCFGSAYTPINREDVIKNLEELTLGIKSENVLLGVHCCGNTDWSIFTEVKAIDIINFDAFGFLDRFVLYADNLKDFLKRGGIICWGVVPTGEFSGHETVDFLAQKIKNSINILINKGLDKDLLLDNLLLSPACGLGSMDIQKSESIFRLLSELSSSLRKNL